MTPAIKPVPTMPCPSGDRHFDPFQQPVRKTGTFVSLQKSSASLLWLWGGYLFAILRVQEDSQHAGLGVARILRHPVEAAGRLVEGVTGLERFGGLVVDGPLVGALHNVFTHRAGVTVRCAGLPRVQRDLDHRRLSLLAVRF